MYIPEEPLEITSKSMPAGARRLLKKLINTANSQLLKPCEIPNMCRQLEEELKKENTQKARRKLETLRKDMAELRSFMETCIPAGTRLVFVYLF